ncbi:MAG: Decaprenyl-phosphate phosphoribosyltransferase [Myxococcota bacterium]|nr:Decaprenyl-phosphate phosphoribosyltransferase [Myxococcota bacterium]
MRKNIQAQAVAWNHGHAVSARRAGSSCHDRSRSRCIRPGAPDYFDPPGFPGMMAAGTIMTPPLIRLLRPKQWIKNAFVMAPLVFAGEVFNPDRFVLALATTLIFCAASSFCYVFNDLHDVMDDRRHPSKSKSRPIAAGDITPGAARASMVLLGGVSLLAFAVNWLTGVVTLAYVAMNVLYTIQLKKVAVVDIFTIATGFVLRVTAGGAAIGVPLTSWMLITTLCLALYLAATKRRQELLDVGGEARSVLGEYSIPMLDSFILYSSTGALVFYGMYVLTTRPRLDVTIPFVLFGFFRYRYIAERKGLGESPTDAVWKDIPLALTVLAWGLVSMWRVAQG